MESPKLTIEELSRFIDNELSESQREEISQKLAECATSEQLLTRLRELTSQVSMSILSSVPEESPVNSDECLTEEDIIEIVEHKASQAKLNKAEKHISSCRRCMLLILQNIRTAVSMNANNWLDLPEDVAADSRISVVSRIRRPDHCIERTEEQLGEIRFNLKGDKTELTQSFSKGKYLLELTLKKISSEVASIAINLQHNQKPKSQAELILTITPDGKQVFRGLTDQSGRSLIRRVQTEDYILSLKDINAIVAMKILAK